MKLSKSIFRKSLSVLLSAGILVTGLPSFAAENNVKAEGNIQQQFFVAVDGDDNGEGTLENPFQTVQRARDEVRKVNDDMTGDIVINIAPGDYYLDETLLLTEEDSGTNGYEIIYQNQGEIGSAHLIGGQKVTGWELCDDSDVDFDLDPALKDKVYKVQLDKEVFNFNTLYVNDERAIMARTQNYEYDERFPMQHGTYMWTENGGAFDLVYKAGDLDQKSIQGMINAQARGEEEIAQVFVWDGGYWNWFTSTLPIDTINAKSRKLTFPQIADKPATNRPKYSIDGGARYFLQGNLAFLDVPGEYHYNKSTGMLYYYPKTEERAIENQEIIAPTMQEIIRFKGADKANPKDEPNPEMQVHNITISGLTLECTDFTNSYSSGWNSFDAKRPIGFFPPEAEGSTNPSYCEQTERAEFQKGIITMVDTNNITVENSRLQNAGLCGIAIWHDNQYNTIKNCEIANVGFMGINMDGGYPGIGKYNNNHTLTNLLIHDIGRLVGHGTGIVAQQTSDNNFSHMEIYNCSRRGIVLGGAWWPRTAQDTFNRMEDSYAYNNRFEYINLYDCQHDGGDDGAIFVSTTFWGKDGLGDKPNYFDQITIDKVGCTTSMNDYKPNGINLDMGVSGTELSNMKIINPQHYNFRLDKLYGDRYVLDNINAWYGKDESFWYGTHDMYKTFDDSKMEYDKIGLTEEFPVVYRAQEKEVKTYEDIYFRDEFDNGLEEWWSLGGVTETSPIYFSDTEDFIGNSFKADAYYNKTSNGCNIGKPFGTELNKVVEIDFFDHVMRGNDTSYCNLSLEDDLYSFARVDDGELFRGIGVDSKAYPDHYVYKVGSMTKKTNILRKYGWHTLKWDYTSGTDVKMYIDEELIATLPAESFSYIGMGDYASLGTNYYDNVVVYGGDEAPAPIPLPPNPVVPEPEKEMKVPGKVEAEDGDLKGGMQVEDCAEGGKAIGYISAGDVYTYEVDVTQTGDYNLNYRIAANNENSGVELWIDGEKVADTTLPKTGGWQNWKTVTHGEKIHVEEGKATIQIKVRQSGFNINWFSLTEDELPPEDVAVTGVTFNVDGELVLGLGNRVNVPYQVLPYNATNKAVTLTSSDEEIIAITADGKVQAKKVGTAEVTITTEEGAKTATCTVKVEDVEKDLISTEEKGVTAEVSSHWDSRYTAKNLIDGSLSTEWVSNRVGYTDPQPTATLTWDSEQTVKAIYAYDRSNNVDFTEQVKVMFNNDMQDTLTLTGLSNDGKIPGVIVLDEARNDITSIQFIIDRDINGGGNKELALGFSELKVYSAMPGEIPVNNIRFEKERFDRFVGESFTLNVPTVTPSTATKPSYDLTIEGDTEAIKLTENRVDGVLRNYTVKALKPGKAVIKVTANGKVGSVVINVGTRDAIQEAIMEAETLYASVPGPSEVHVALKAAIDTAKTIYADKTATLEQVNEAVEALEEAIRSFNKALEEAVQTAEEIANGLVIPAPEKGDTKLDIPTVPFGYKVSIVATNPIGIVYNNGTIVTPAKDTDVIVTLRVKKLSDNTTATKEQSVRIFGNSAPITTVSAITVNTTVGTAPVLPEVVEVIYADETKGMARVTWDEIDPESYAEIGEFEVAGQVEGTELKAIAKVNVLPKEAEEALSILTGVDEVKSEESFEIQLGLDKVKEPAFAADLVVDYDADLFELEKVTGVVPTQVVGDKEEAGSIRILTSTPGGIVESANLLALNFKTKAIETDKQGKISVRQGLLGTVVDGKDGLVNVTGTEKTVNVKGIPVIVTEPEDVNEDQVIDIADLALVAYYYKAQVGDGNWTQAQKADVNNDGKVDIEDLTHVATKILEK